MTTQPQLLLVATAVFPVLGAIGTLAAAMIQLPAWHHRERSVFEKTGTPRKNVPRLDRLQASSALPESVENAKTLRQKSLRSRGTKSETALSVWGHAIARVGIIGGCLSGVILAVMIFDEGDTSSPVIRTPLWTWLSSSSPRSVSLEFGLEATWLKATLVSLAGGLTLLSLSTNAARKDRILNEWTVLTNSLLYAAATIFLFAPNFAQALLGWGGVSFMTIAQFRVTRTNASANPSRRTNAIDSQRDVFVSTAGYSSPQSRPSALDPSQHINAAVTNQNTAIKLLATTLTLLERICFDGCWRFFTVAFPNWLAEQVELIEQSPVSFQLLATLLCLAALMLTWL